MSKTPYKANPDSSKAKRNRWRIIAEIPNNIRDRILQRFAPAHPVHYAKVITFAYDVDDQFTFPSGNIEFSVLGRFRNDSADVLIVQAKRGSEVPILYRADNNTPLAITLSVADGVSPREAIDQVDWDDVEDFPSDGRLRFTAPFCKKPLWKDKPTRAS